MMDEELDQRLPTRLAWGAWAFVLAFFAWAFFLYPAWATVSATFSDSMRKSAQSPQLADSFRSTSARYSSWASEYLETQRAAKLNSSDVAGTEWPMFGSVFYLMTTEELTKTQPELLEDSDVREAIDRAAKVVASPDTATWVKTKWGVDYLKSENVFYRMLLIMGLTIHHDLTGSQDHVPLIEKQSRTLTAELLDAHLHLADDYPNECYPNDLVWAVAAVKRAARFGFVPMAEVELLGAGMLDTFNGPSMTPHGLPSFQVQKADGKPLQRARGSGNSGIIPLAAELDAQVAGAWFSAYLEHYWKAGWVSGFRELPVGEGNLEDVDSGPTLFGVGSVATGFGLGAARSVGRFDYAVPLALQIVPASWPTPFGTVLPGVLGWAAADGWCFGELALQFSMTRPVESENQTPFEGSVPSMVWVFLAFYLAGGAGLLWRSWVALAHARAKK